VRSECVGAETPSASRRNHLAAVSAPTFLLVTQETVKSKAMANKLPKIISAKLSP
jgi:hypothetical protein